MQVNDINGDYNLTIDNTSYKLTISGTSEKPKAKVTTGDKKLGAKLTFANDWMTLVLTSPDENKKEYTRLIASVPRNLLGQRWPASPFFQVPLPDLR